MNDSDLSLIEKHIPSFSEKRHAENVYFQMVYDDGTISGDIFPHVCHQGLFRLKDIDNKALNNSPVAIINSLQELLVPDDIALRFYEWLLNLSPYRNCFVTKSAEKLLEDHIIIGDCNASANLLADAMIATRSCTEKYSPGIHNTIFVWHRLVELGVNPDAAFIASNRLTIVDGQLSIRSYPYSHTAIVNPNRSWSRFVTHNPDLSNDLPYRERKTYDHHVNEPFNIWWSSDTPILTMMEQAALKTTFKKVNNNPFSVADPSVTTYPCEPALEEIAFCINNLIKETCNVKVAA